ncbi:hypothetical protein CMQ_2465 [Grosmannia clavigera kw1407]|uniref:Uncharacterized protein n=1 Tax=Grosmannia clavigera (strain kw1407 / UAMH 11150) TaxID=655863 RepID=F0XJ46_GROCL|nr:uncharacterized protein CMQ_2465 [Grosmannia clavigera kw1407]EFX02416.1 hypothetical protein CMQ_2465 [Grosmannia clavigera kw1407]
MDERLQSANIPHGEKHDVTISSETEVTSLVVGPCGSWNPSYLTGCRDLDERVFLGPAGGLSGGVVGISADGDIGLVIIVRHLHAQAAATVRLVTTHPVAHVVRLLKGVLAVGDVADKAMHSRLLRRVLISRIYAPDDLWTVLEEIESAVPFRRLWSATMADGGSRNDGSSDNVPDGKALPVNTGLPLVVITEIDHHFKWMRLQGPRGLRLHELYGQLMRRLRALASEKPASGSARPLILILNSTVVQKPWVEPASVLTGEAAGGTAEEDHGGDGDGIQNTSVSIEADENYEIAVSLLRQRKLQPLNETSDEKSNIVRRCYREISKTQKIVPRYKSFMDYMCNLHVCFTRAPPDVDGLWEWECSSSRDTGQDSALGQALWVVTVEHDEAEIFKSDNERFGLVQFSHGALQDVFPASKWMPIAGGC